MPLLPPADEDWSDGEIAIRNSSLSGVFLPAIQVVVFGIVIVLISLVGVAKLSGFAVLGALVAGGMLGAVRASTRAALLPQFDAATTPCEA